MKTQGVAINFDLFDQLFVRNFEQEMGLLSISEEPSTHRFLNVLLGKLGPKIG